MMYKCSVSRLLMMYFFSKSAKKVFLWVFLNSYSACFQGLFLFSFCLQLFLRNKQPFNLKTKVKQLNSKSLENQKLLHYWGLFQDFPSVLYLQTKSSHPLGVKLAIRYSSLALNISSISIIPVMFLGSGNISVICVPSVVILLIKVILSLH